METQLETHIDIVREDEAFIKKYDSVIKEEDPLFKKDNFKHLQNNDFPENLNIRENNWKTGTNSMQFGNSMQYGKKSGTFLKTHKSMQYKEDLR